MGMVPYYRVDRRTADASGGSYHRGDLAILHDHTEHPDAWPGDGSQLIDRESVFDGLERPLIRPLSSLGMSGHIKCPGGHAIAVRNAPHGDFCGGWLYGTEG